jgi:uncharacterized protein YecT (DUF1311 family)
MSWLLGIALATTPYIAPDCELIRDGEHNSHCAQLALQHADMELSQLLDKVRKVSVEFSLNSLNGKEHELDRDPQILEKTRAEAIKKITDAHSSWLIYRERECMMQNVTLEPDYTEFVSYKQCLSYLTYQRTSYLNEMFYPYFVSFGEAQ